MAYSILNEEEDYRRQVLAAARKARAKAQEELQRQFNDRVYTAAERAKLKYLRMNTARSSRHLEIASSEWAQFGDGE